MIEAVIRRLLARMATSPPFNPVHDWLTRTSAIIFMLHRFADPQLGINGHDPDRLRQFLEWLRARGRPIVSVGELASRLREGRSLDGAVCFTVDDGYQDFANVGLNVFTEFNCPVTVFLPTDFVDGDCWMWWDKIEYVVTETEVSGLVPSDIGPVLEDNQESWSLRTPTNVRIVRRSLIEIAKGLDPEARDRLISNLASCLEVSVPESAPKPRYQAMTWPQIRQCAEAGATFGPHTRTHPWLQATSPSQAREEIAGSWARLNEEVPHATPVFCYPNGTPDSFGAREMELVRDSGLKAAVTAIPEMVRRGDANEAMDSAFRLPRFAYPDDLLRARRISTGLANLRDRLSRTRMVDESTSPGTPRRP